MTEASTANIETEAILQELPVSVAEQVGERALSAVVTESQNGNGNEAITSLEAPEGWFSPNKLAQELGCGRKVVLKVLEPHREEQLGWFQQFKAPVNNDLIEYLHPDAVALARKTIIDSRPPEGWRTNKSIATELGIAHGAIGKFVRKLQEENPELAGVVYVGPNGHPAEHLPPELVEKVLQEYTEREAVPDGWMTNNALADELGVDMSTTKRIAEPILEEQPELLRPFLNARGNVVKHYSPELVQKIRNELASRVNAPEGWVTKRQLSKSLGCAEDTIDRIISDIPNKPEGWVKNYTVKSGHLAQHLGPELANHVSEVLNNREDAPEDWMTISAIRKELGVMDKTVERFIDTYIDEFENASKVYKDSIGTPRIHFSPELVQRVRDVLSQQQPAPEGWLTCTSLADELGVSYDVVKRLAYLAKGDHDDWVSLYHGANKQASEHYSPELIEAIKQTIEIDKYQRELTEKERAEQLALIENLSETVEDLSEGESIEAQKFRDLIELFGAEEVVDILYSYHPEYKRIPLPYVRSILADYLGEYLVIRGELQLDKLESAVDLLSDQNLKARLVEVVKNDCLKFYNQLQKVSVGRDELGLISSYISHLREATSGFESTELTDVFDAVELYYQTLFNDVHKPANLLDEIKEGRPFPDLNQRINIKEIETKQKMLIADEMGVGKSASAILAKESLGVKTAMIVVPSNVVDTWLGYLSDRVDDSG